MVAALRDEARSLGPAPRRWRGDSTVEVELSGPGPRRARAAAERLVDGGCEALVSWGVAGGLDPALAAGTLIVPRVIVDGDAHRLDVDNALARLFESTLRPDEPRGAALASAMHAVTSREAKAALHRRLAAAAVDMESASVQALAAERGLPFAAVRSIADRADFALPGALVDALNDEGGVRTGALVTRLLARPGDILPLLRLARDYRAALARLREAARMLTA